MGGAGEDFDWEDFEYMCRVFLLYLCSCSADETPAAAAAAPVTVKADAKVEETKAAKIVTVPRNGRSTRNIGFRSEAKLVKLVNAAPLVSAAVPRHHERPELNRWIYIYITDTTGCGCLLLLHHG